MGSFWFWGQDVGSDCDSSWSLLIFLLRVYQNQNPLVTSLVVPVLFLFCVALWFILRGA